MAGVNGAASLKRYWNNKRIRYQNSSFPTANGLGGVVEPCLTRNYHKPAAFSMQPVYVCFGYPYKFLSLRFKPPDFLCMMNGTM